MALGSFTTTLTVPPTTGSTGTRELGLGTERLARVAYTRCLKMAVPPPIYRSSTGLHEMDNWLVLEDFSTDALDTVKREGCVFAEATTCVPVPFLID